MNKNRKIFIISLILISVFSINIIASASDSSDENDPNIAASITSAAAVVIDFQTGLIVYEFNADELRVPASMVKMVAVYVVLDEIATGRINMDTGISIRERTSAFSFNRAYSNVPLHTDSIYSISELLDVIIIRSASAATVALGEGVFGSEAAMVAKMNEKAADLGIRAIFRDSWGGSRDNRISARGMAEITRAMINDYPEILEFTSKTEVYFEELPYRSTNPLLTDYPGVDGFKTGFTNPAGWCFTGTAQQGFRRLISVTMGSEFGHRFLDSIVLLDYGFYNVDRVIAGSLRDALQPADTVKVSGSALIPISMLDIDEAQNLTLLDTALILNGS